MDDPSRNVSQNPLGRWVKGLLLGRVVVITFLWVALLVVELTGEPTPTRLPLTYLILITYVLSILYALVLRQQPDLQRFYLLQVWVDLLIETAIVQSTGGLDSGFVFLYILSIISAGIALPGRSIFGVAAGASVLYSLLAYLDFNAILHPLPSPFTFRPDTTLSGSYVLYATLLRITAFWVVALLSRYLAESLRQTGQVLQEQRAHLIGLRAFHENVVNSMNSGLLITDMSGRVVSANYAAERILQLAPGARHGWLAQEALSFIDLENIVRKAGALDAGLNRTEGWFERRDGQKIILGISYSPLRDEQGTVHGLIFNFQDITAIRAMEVEIKRAEQLAAVGRLSAAIAHEIRNPLASISGSIQLLRSELVLDESNQRLMDIVAREIERLNRLITDFLGYARPRPLQYAEVDVHKLISGTLDLLCNGLPEGSAVTIRTEFASAIPTMTVDPQGLRQVIWNLCLNAIEAMHHQGALTVRTALQPVLNHPYHGHMERPKATQELIIDVMDTGPGMPLEVKEKVFEPFYSTKDGGTGLGLATVDRIIYNHRGRVEVDSQLGHGTRVRIHLPFLSSTANTTNIPGGE
ncbi:MAG TPA: ATP-binding protein [Candidatus Tectomicrobia bacterium]|nr:ATP-binding protein [Candidatus Tectomicrobia bacterium]